MLPRYDKNARRKSFEQLPKGAYVVKILNAVEEHSKNGTGSHIKISFDIAEGEYAGFYAQQYKANTNENKDWPYDAVFFVNIPHDNCPEWMRLNYNTFFADLEDSNDGFVCTDAKAMKNKVIGGKFRIEQTTYNGNVYDHTRLYWTCVADDVRNGKAGKMPKDKLLDASGSAPEVNEGFMNIPDNLEDEGLPFN